ncbi:MAG: hypothetical protein KDK45_16060, partial [Leptospiraceae bacterium]|nr:hypothetical protein [Leptospiraceae bacterium]
MKFYIRFFAFLLFSTILFAEDKEIFLPFPKDSTESYAQEKSQNNTEENSSAENKISKGDSSSSGEIKNSSG